MVTATHRVTTVFLLSTLLGLTAVAAGARDDAGALYPAEPSPPSPARVPPEADASVPPETVPGDVPAADESLLPPDAPVEGAPATLPPDAPVTAPEETQPPPARDDAVPGTLPGNAGGGTPEQRLEGVRERARQ